MVVLVSSLVFFQVHDASALTDAKEGGCIQCAAELWANCANGGGGVCMTGYGTVGGGGGTAASMTETGREASEAFSKLNACACGFPYAADWYKLCGAGAGGGGACASMTVAGNQPFAPP